MVVSHFILRDLTFRTEFDTIRAAQQVFNLKLTANPENTALYKSTEGLPRD